MVRRLVTAVTTLLITGLVTVSVAAQTDGHKGEHKHDVEVKVGQLHVVDPWARPATPPRAGAAYLVVGDDGTAGDRLTAARTEVAGRVELHTHVNDNGIMRMRPVEGGAMVVPPGGHLEMAPGGLHLMLMDLKRPLKAGETFPLTLVFEKSGEVTVPVSVKAPGQEPKAHNHGSHGGH